MITLALCRSSLRVLSISGSSSYISPLGEATGPARADISAGTSEFGRASCCVTGLSLSPVLDIFYLGEKSPASAGNSAALAGNSALGGKFCCLGGKFCSRREILLLAGKSARFWSNLPLWEISCLVVSAENDLPTAWAGKSAALTESLLPAVSAENCLPAVSAESPAWAGKSTLAGNMPDSAQLCCGRFTNSVPADVIVAALAGSECYQPRLLQYSSQSGFNLMLHFLPSARKYALGGKFYEDTGNYSSIHKI
ncbi:hypothetical protein V6N12_035618 [Hibiscus sabdariffa]|uniref:Uncharacterized protein n=1 Tax=Hibiscus sabdariffa TaxID=183260 RepID=A0ABR2EN89_9ROSI